MSATHALIGSVSSGGGADKFNAWGGLITQWDGQATVLTDTSGENHHGTTTGALINAGAAKIGSYGLQNSWTNDQDHANRAATLSTMGATSAFSFSGWTKFTGLATYWDSPVGGGPGSWASGFGIYLKDIVGATNCSITGWVNGYSSNAITKTSFNPQIWNHLALTYDGSTLAFYVNGTQVGTSSESGAVTDTAPGIGNFTDSGGIYGYGYDGYCDEYGFWSSALTSAEVTAIYNSGTPLDLTSDSGNYASSSDLVGYYQFNEKNTYRVHTFRGDGSFEISGGEATVTYFMAGGGGGGGGQANYNSSGGGGGAGGVRTGTATLTAGSSPYAVTVGTGGAGGSNAAGAVGGNSVFNSLTADGGGLGGKDSAGGAGGSGGGAGMGYTSTFSGGAASGGGTGNAGGTAGNQASGHYGSGGGGGSGGAGTNYSTTAGGAGGAGSIQMTPIGSFTAFYAGGGGGAGTGTQGVGSSGGGDGNKANILNSGKSNNAVPNTGSGGGGGAYYSTATIGGTGATGIVILRYVVE